MGFEGEFASYEPLRRMLDSDKVRSLQDRLKIRNQEEETDSFSGSIINKSDLPESSIQPDLVLAIDGSNLAAKAENGFPGAEFGYITIASVLIDLKLIEDLEKNVVYIKDNILTNPLNNLSLASLSRLRCWINSITDEAYFNFSRSSRIIE